MARNSELILCSGIRLDREYSNVIDYSESDMLSLCRTNKIGGDSNYSFIRSESRLVTSIPYGTALQGNYIAFQNPDYSNKWFFAFVDDVKYVNDNSTEIFYTIDYFSTWFRNLTLNDCLVVREHTNDDTIGANTLNEDLNLGDIIEQDETIDASFSSYYLVIETGYDPQNQKKINLFTMRNGSANAHYLALFPFTLKDNQTNRDWIAKAMHFMNCIETSQNVGSDYIFNMYVVPSAIVTLTDLTLVSFDYQATGWSEAQRVEYYKFNKSTFEPEYFNINIPKLRSFDDYPSVKNNKLFVYPYNYLFVSNNAGSGNVYKYEDFVDSDNATFQFVGAWQIGASGKLIPRNYKTKIATTTPTDNCDESIPLGKYPTFNWSSDSFVNWLTQNGINIATGLGIGAVGVLGAVLTGGASAIATVGVATASGATLGTIGKLTEASIKPNMTNGENTADAQYSAGLTTFVFKRMRPKAEYLRIADDYFSTYGYKTNRMKIPNITGRTYWNYVEIGQNESIGHGSIPADALNTINNAFHQGVTIWHNHSNIGNYELTNSIVTP